MGEIEKRTWRLVLAYDGTDFHGWQVQPGRRTVQGELRAAIEQITGERILPQGSGRTDAGVHALSQVASFQLSTPIPEENLARALNRRLPPAIRVLDARWMPEGFHARHDAQGKTYEYRIFRGELCSPWLARFVYGTKQPLDVEAMERAAQMVVGEHDFTSFAASEPELGQRRSKKLSRVIGPVAAIEARSEPSGAVRTIHLSSWVHRMANLPEFTLPEFPVSRREENPPNADLLVYRVRGSGFLHHMVRNLVGTFLEMGRGHLAAEAVAEILAARDRARAGPTAPARGLFLTEVDYVPVTLSYRP